MKRLVSTIILFQCTWCLAQQSQVTYYDAYWNKTTSKDSAEYYRIVERKDAHYIVKDFYISGTMQMIGAFSILKPEIKDGYFIWYYPNGRKYSEGNFKHGKREGLWVYWFPDGLKKEVVNFFPGRDRYSRRWKSKRVKRSEDYYRRAVNKRENKNYPAALKLLETAIKANPYYSEAYFERGLIRCMEEDKQAGCIDIKKAKEYGFPDNKSLIQMIQSCCDQ